jgi:hypothetical protein
VCLVDDWADFCIHFRYRMLKLRCWTSTNEWHQFQRVVVLYESILDDTPAQPSHTNDLQCIQNINHQSILDHFRY